MTPEAQRTRAALDGLAEALARLGEEAAALSQRSRRLREELVAGALLRQVVPAEERPLVVQRVTELLELLAEAGSEVRRAEAAQLRAEGLTHAEIAALLGVTRQRVGALLTARADLT